MQRSILIADDNKIIRKTLRAVLEQNTELSCNEAVNGSDAIEKARLLHPDLIIMDLAMPDINGIEASQAIRKLLPNIPIVMFTDYKTKFLEAEAAAYGITGVLSKSGDVCILTREIENLLRANGF